MPAPPLRLIVTAAHAGVSPGAVPVGGGAAVVHQLVREWSGRADLRLTVLGLGERIETGGVDYQQVPVTWPPGRGPADLVRLGELAYARMSRAFERAATRYILAQPDREQLCVLANDISEGPGFAALAAAGVAVVTLWHVDVVDYFCRFYLRGLDPARAVAWHRRLGRAAGLLPGVLKLVFQKQAHCVAGSRRHVVPSAGMRDVLARCYPGCAERVEVVPWGAWSTPAPTADVEREKASLRAVLAPREGEPVLLTLSRISPEKGLERVLRALAWGEARGEVPAGLRLWIAGEAAFMQGERYRRKLVREALRLRVAKVAFVGYASGARKQALWELADVYVFPSRHESYGLTLAEALRAGVPVVTTAHHSAADLVPPEAGVIVPNAPEAAVAPALWTALAGLLADPARRGRMAAAARAHGATLDFAPAAGRVLALCRDAARLPRSSDRP